MIWSISSMEHILIEYFFLYLTGPQSQHSWVILFNIKNKKDVCHHKFSLFYRYKILNNFCAGYSCIAYLLDHSGEATAQCPRVFWDALAESFDRLDILVNEKNTMHTRGTIAFAKWLLTA